MNPKPTTIYLATDHAGFAYKELTKQHLQDAGYTVVDCGAEAYDGLDDYPDYMIKAAQGVSHDVGSVAVVFGGSGQGEAIVVNRFPRVRAAVCYGGDMAQEMVTLSREHNDSNVLSIGARFVGEDQLLALIDTWLATPFSNEERHVRRLSKVKNIHTN